MRNEDNLFKIQVAAQLTIFQLLLWEVANHVRSSWFSQLQSAVVLSLHHTEWPAADFRGVDSLQIHDFQ